MNHAVPPSPFALVKRAFLGALVVSIGIAAMLAIVAILAGRFGWLEVRILATAATIAGASVCGLACGAALSAGRGRVVPSAGLALSALAALLLIALTWFDASRDMWKAAACLSVFAVACAHVSLLSMARLADEFRWALPAALVTIFGVALLITLIIVGEARGSDFFRLLGVSVILDAAITVLLPVLHRLSRDRMPPDDVEADSPTRTIESIDAEINQLRARIEELEWLRETVERPEPRVMQTVRRRS